MFARMAWGLAVVLAAVAAAWALEKGAEEPGPAAPKPEPITRTETGTVKEPRADEKAKKEKPWPRAQKIFVITVHDEIDHGLEYSIRRRVAEAKAAGADLIVFDVDTFGGRLDAAFKISEFVSRIEAVRTVAYVSKKAISAGALFAVSCNQIVVGQGATLGDCAPIVISREGGYKLLGEKVQSPLRAKFRALAKRNGHPPLLCEAMVTKELEVYRLVAKDGKSQRFVKASEYEKMNILEKDKYHDPETVVEKDQLLTLDDEEALKYGLARHRVKDFAELVRIYGAAGASVTKAETSWSEETVRFLNSMPVASLLMMVGLAALYFAFKTPGLGLPEGVAAVCFVILFGSKYLAGLANEWEIVIFVLGVAFLAVEVFVLPGFGVSGVIGIVLIVAALLLSLQDFVFPRAPYEFRELGYNTLCVLGSFLMSLVLFCTIVRSMPKMPYLSKLVLQTAEHAEAGFTQASAERRSLVGRVGFAVSMLRPAGRAEIDDEMVDVVAEGDYVEKGTRIEVIEVKGNRVVVRRA